MSNDLQRAIERVKAIEADNLQAYEYWKSIASDAADMGVMKFLIRSGEDSRIITELESLAATPAEPECFCGFDTNPASSPRMDIHCPKHDAAGPEQRVPQGLAMFCAHANEVPARCPCAAGCYCKTHTCKPRCIHCDPVHVPTGSDDWCNCPCPTQLGF